MKYIEIATALEKHRELIGRKEQNGTRLDELVPVPVGLEDSFWRCYIDTRDSKAALDLLESIVGPAVYECDFRIYGVYNKDFINEHSLLFYLPLFQ